MPPAQILIHAGDFKTGTTVLQHWLDSGAARAHGLAALPGRAPHAGLVWDLNAPDRIGGRIAAIAAAAADCAAEVLVVSAEHFELADPARLRAVLDAHLPGGAAAVRVISWVRPHLPALLARYAESTKIGSFDGTPLAYLDWPPTAVRLGYAARFARWRTAFGARFALRLYDRGRMPGGDIRRDFALAVTGRDPGPLPAAPDPNPSPGIGGLAIARALHRATGVLPQGSVAERARWTIGREIGRIMAATGQPPDDPPLVADRALALAVAARFGADAAAVDAAFLADGVMAAALARDLAAAPALLPGPGCDPEPDRILSAATRGVIALWGAFLARGLAQEADARALDRIYHEENRPLAEAERGTRDGR